MSRNILALVLCLSVFLLSNLVSPVSARREPIEAEIPISLGADFSGMFAFDTVSDILYFDDRWYVLTSLEDPNMVNKIVITEYDYYFQTITGQQIINPPSSYNYRECADIQFINSTDFHFVCHYHDSGGFFHQSYFIMKFDDLSYTTYNIDTYGAPFGNPRLSNLGAGVTGSQDVHIAFIDAFTYILRRWRDLTTSPVEDTYPMPTITALYQFVPFQSVSASGDSCFHDSGTDCGSWLVYVATTSGDPNKRLYVNEYSTGVCGFNPSHFCYFSLEAFNLYHTKKVITDQQVQDFDVYKGSNYWEVTYQDFNTDKWWLAYFDNEWNLITKYQLEDYYGAPYRTALSPSSLYNRYASYDSYDLSRFQDYDEIKVNCKFYSGGACPSTTCGITVSEVGNISNKVTNQLNHSGCLAGGEHNWYYDFSLPASLQEKNLKVEFNISCTYPYTCNFSNSFPPIIDYFVPTTETRPRMDLGLEDKRVFVFSGYEGTGEDSKTFNYQFPFVISEEEVCTCNPYAMDGCYDSQRKYTRVCYPPACDDEVKFEYDPVCVSGACAPTRYRCYNETTLCLWNSDCSWELTDCTECAYYCNQGTDACYDSPTCLPCPNPEMVQEAFPDCSCFCDNFCALSYENISVSCACRSMTIDTQEWQDNPVQMFQDMSSGITGMFGGFAIPLAIIMLAIGFASVISMIMRKSIK